MATVVWKGGATAVTQVETFTLNNDFDDSETLVRMTMTDEAGDTATVDITPDGVDETVIASLWLTALQNSSNVLFAAVTWTSSLGVVTGTAKIAGVPFYAVSAVTGTGTSTDSITTASAGPFDMETVANYVDGALAVDGDNLYILSHPINERSYSILYGLDQSAVQVADFNVGESFEGDIGQTNNKYYLRIDPNPAAGTGKFVFNGRGNACWIDGAIDTCFVLGGINSKDMLQLKGTITVLYIQGSKVQGRITIADSASLPKAYMFDAPGAYLKIGTSVSDLTDLDMNSGKVLLETTPAASANINVNGGVLDTEIATWANNPVINQRGGRINFNAAGIIATINMFAGDFSFANNKIGLTSAGNPGPTISTLEQWSGNVDAINALDSIVISDYIRHGGTLIGAATASPTLGHI